ncbi:DUF1129 family protein [Ornithinibacillus xuwenensis]|uniref:DUF1129 family protein n=1 Tax=Ornithinibacillus xuwenensis TaxID=3144668 RepID=A0ABU9XLT6_9BACI
MNSKDIIKMNNDLREELSEENKKIYEDMLVYIRLNANKSEQQTEEVLLELLEHLLQAQSEGKTAKDVFGDDFKVYCDELIEEIPGEKKSQALLFGSYIIMHYLAILSTFYGASSFLLHQFFDIGSIEFTFSLGSGAAIILIDLILLYFFIKVVFRWMKGSTFREKEIKKWVEFLQIWLICVVFIGLSLAVTIFMPDFGGPISIPVLTFVGVGIILFIVSFVLNKKYRITK